MKKITFAALTLLTLVGISLGASAVKSSCCPTGDCCKGGQCCRTHNHQK